MCLFHIPIHLHLFLSAVLIFKGKAEKKWMFINLLPRLSDGPRLNSHKACSPVFFFFFFGSRTCINVRAFLCLTITLCVTLTRPVFYAWFLWHVSTLFSWKLVRLKGEKYLILPCLLFVRNNLKFLTALYYSPVTNYSNHKH